MTEQEVFGIVIPTYNSERHIGRLLESIRVQDHVSYSVTVVDAGSNDKTVQIARSYHARIIEVSRPEKYTPWITHPLPAYSRNLGARSTSSRILLHLDSDMELIATDVLTRLEALIDPGHQAAVIHEIDIAEGFWPSCKALERSCYRNTEAEAARAVTRELFELVGGYDQAVSSGEDFLITSQYDRQTRVVRDHDLFVRHHAGRYSLRSHLGKKFVYGRTAKAYLGRAREAGARSSSAIALDSMRAYLRNWRLMFRHPVKFICVIPLRVMEFLAIRLGMQFASR